MIALTPFFADRGCHIRIYEEAKILRKSGYDVIVCTYHNGRDLKGIRTERIVNIPWYTKLEAGPSLHKIYLDFFLLLKCISVASKVNLVAIHSHLHEGALIGKIVASILKKH